MTVAKEVYEYSEALKKSIEYFKGDDLAAKVFVDKYALRNGEGEILEDTPDKMHRRLAKEFARIEKNKFKKPIREEDIYNYFKDFKYIIPQGSAMSGIGDTYKYVSLSNCFVGQSPLDSYSGICKADEEIVNISKRRGGIGFDISKLRPVGSVTTNAARSSTGIVPFCERYSNTIREVGQNSRRGALILTISVHHPEISNFIAMKKDLRKVTGANISVRLTDEFLNAVDKNKKYEQRWPVDSKDPTISNMVEARKIWEKIIRNSWACLDYDTKLDILKDGKIINIKIGDFYNLFHNDKKSIFEILSLNLNNKKIEKKKITNAQEYFNNKKMIEIKVGGSKVMATEDHIFYIINKAGNISSLPIKDIKIGDKLLFAKSTYVPNIEIDHINLKNCLEYFKGNGNKLVGKPIDLLLRNEKVIKYLGKYSNGWNKATCYRDLGYIPISEVLYLIKNGIKIPENIYFSPSRSLDLKLPLKIKIDQDLATFLGLWLAEGSYNKGSVCFHIHTKELKSYKKIFDKISARFKCNYNIDTNNNYTRIYFCSRFLVLFIQAIKLKPYLEEKRIPPFIFNSSLKNIKAFLKGFFSGDGAVNKGTPSVSQSNYNIIYNVRKLLLRIGIHSRISISQQSKTKIIKGKICNIKDSYRLNIYSQFNCIFKKEIGFCQDSKHSLIQEKAESFKYGVPVESNYDLLHKIFRTRGKKYIKKSTFKKYKQLYSDKKIKEILDCDVYFLELEDKKEVLDVDNVYDITVKDNHTFVLPNGIILSNSAEPGILMWDNIIRESPADCYKEFKTVSVNPCSELPLSERGNCTLLLLNLYSFVENPFSKSAKFNFDKLYKYAEIAQRLMDDMIDLEIEYINRIINKIKEDPEPINIKKDELSLWESIKKSCQNGRRTGTGANAVGDAIAACGYKYGSRKSIEFVEKIFKVLKLGCYRSSVDMAKEIGPFKIWEHELEKNNPFLLRIKQDDLKLWKDMKKHGRRNIGLLTLSPSGSVSILTRTTSGIEPLFQLSYVRRKKINHDDTDTKINFIDNNGDKWQEFQVIHPKVKVWEEISGEKNITKSPWYGCCAEDIKWEDRIELQAKTNLQIDHSISATINLPEETTVEEVSKIYTLAWKKGVKGITVYRKNCRTGVLIDNVKQKDNENHIIKTTAPKRPKELQGNIHHVSVKGNKYFVLVGVLNEQEPYEVFAGHKNIEKLPDRIIIKKRKRNTYCIMDVTMKEVLLDDISKYITDEEEALTRIISLGLRHGADINFITHQLEKTSGNMLGFAKAISRVLKKYIEEGSMVHGESCPDCKGELKRQEGCVVCSCGFSRCG